MGDGTYPGQAFGNGYLCMTHPIRLGAVPTSSWGGAYLPLDFGSPSLTMVQPGDSKRFQYGFRDPAAGGSDLDLTAAWSQDFCP